MPADGLCLYHALVAASDFSAYMAMTSADRAAAAGCLRQKTILELVASGLHSQAARLSLSGSAGYPDEEDFIYIAMASGCLLYTSPSPRDRG